MSDSILVRASRDGDAFHYHWAARRALQLLMPKSGLVAITIEGASTSELPSAGAAEAGEELIDVGEYYGSTEIEKATLVRYIQLKHSTLRTEEVWQPSGLEKTIKGFAERYISLLRKMPTVPLHEKLEFWFVTNRPVSASFVEAVHDAASQSTPRHPTDLAKLKSFTSLDGAALALFCKMLRFEDRQDDYWNQRNILWQDVSGYLPELDMDAPTSLKELVNDKALSKSATNPSITKMDVLRALRTDETDLFPAPCLIERLDDAVPREQESALIGAITGASGKPVVIEADAGVGKTIFSTRIGAALPAGSITILYDCFGNGGYRSATGYRHRHRIALVQIVNELSALGLCHPLVPTSKADTTAYMRSFMHRIRQSISVLQASNPDALLCVIIDAADNAQMAAEEINEPRSFVRDLLQETLPPGMRLVTLCRPYRKAMLNPPSGTPSLTLKAFSRPETAAHLRRRFPDASELDVDEFHRLSSHNPRVQALALSRKAPLAEILRLLGPNPTTVESAIGAILDNSIAKLRDVAGSIEGAQIDLICRALAVLRPLIPISVLAAMSGVDQAAIRSFALDLGRPLVVNGDTIQFFDEPAETWFRERYRPNEASIKEFVTRLQVLASSIPYAASALPQLMLEAGQFTELVDLALTSAGLPASSPVERRDLELQRLQFALKASLRIRRWADAAKLALKAGGESAGDDRQRILIQGNVDLGAAFMDSGAVQALVSRRTFGSGWLGSHHVYEAALLSGYSELIGEARSRLRMAEEWLFNWSQMSPEKRKEERVSDDDRAAMAMAHFRIHGEKAAARSLRAWQPRYISYEAGRIIARRFLDHGWFSELSKLAVAAENDLGLLLAIGLETRNLNRMLPFEAAKRGFKLLSNSRIKVEHHDHTSDAPLSAITAMVETALQQSICDATAAKALLDRYLPPTPPFNLASRYSGLRGASMRAYALRAVLSGTPLQLSDLATPELRKEMTAASRPSESSDLREFKENIGALLPWYDLWARAFRQQVQAADLAQAIEDTKIASAQAEKLRYRDDSSTADEIANLWIDILCEAGCANKASIQRLIEWSKSLKRQLFTPTLNRLARICSQTTDAQALAFDFAQTAFAILRDERSDAQNKAEGYVDIARSILSISRSESESYFNQAVEVASKIGDENLARWDSLICLAERAARDDQPAPETAYKFARCAEVTRAYVERDKHFAWDATVEALAGLCSSSALAIISRWRDRRFGSQSRILGAALEALVTRRLLNPLDALPLIAFRPGCNESKLIEAALLSSDADTKSTTLNLAYRFMALETQQLEQWRSLERAATTASVELSGLRARVDDGEAKAILRARESDSERYVAPVTEEANWDEIFLGCDLAAATDITIAYRRFRTGGGPHYSNIFFDKAIGRLSIGKEAEFVRAFGGIVEFDLYDLRRLLEAAPEPWQHRFSIRTAFAFTVKEFFRRFCLEIKRNRHYEVVPFRLVSRLSGLDEAELANVILVGVGEATEHLGADALFNLVCWLSPTLAHDQALEVLSFGLDLFEPVLEDNDGDGPWREALLPPAKIESALAGYIWAGLASPVAAIRWEAAHVVVNLFAMRRTHVIAELIATASTGHSEPFADKTFVFFALHARQWLLIALSRAALEYGTLLVPYVDYLSKHATRDEPHVLVRLFAARALLTLDAQGWLPLTQARQQQLNNINVSPFAPVKSEASGGHTPSRIGAAAVQDERLEADRYFFGIDFGPFWLAPLGRCFGMFQPETEVETLKAVRQDLSYVGAQRWDGDERGRRRLYRHEDTYFRDSSYPRVDDYGFYISYHAMLITAGRLLATRPMIEHSHDWEDNRFSDWIKPHDLTRPDGRWLADRRDPQPIGNPDWIDERNFAGWASSTSIGTIERALYPEPDNINVWGRWSVQDTNREEDISVRSALVSRERSAALLRALQTTDNPHNFRIPSANDERQIDQQLFKLRGWIVSEPLSGGIDGTDYWAGSVRFPAPEPAPFVIERMRLRGDSDHRIWHAVSIAVPVLRSETWGTMRGDDSSEPPNGYRLQSTIAFVVKLLKTVDMDLLVEVEVQRRSRRQNYESTSVDEFQTIRPSTRLFIINSDGTVRTL